MVFSEQELLALVASIFDSHGDPNVLVGIGDDAAVVRGLCPPSDYN